MTDAIDKLDNVPVCGCMDCRRAYEIALKQFQELYSNNCLHAYIAVAQATVVITEMMLATAPEATPNALRTSDELSTEPVLDALRQRLQDIVDAREAPKN